MRGALFAVALAWLAAPVLGDDLDLKSIVQEHIIDGYDDLAHHASWLALHAEANCDPTYPPLIAQFHLAFDQWVNVSHLRFGPSEVDDRAFALAFWPDPRSATPKALSALMRNQDESVLTPEAFKDVSVAARGFYALEHLLFDPAFAPKSAPDYHCALTRAISREILANAIALRDDWRESYGALLVTTENDTYRTSTEAARQLFTALSAGLEFTSQTRLGRPMGTFEHPRPNRAEARRSGRSLRHVILSLQATRDLAALISNENEQLDRAFKVAIERAIALDDPVFAGVATPQGRFEVEVLQQSIDAIRDILADEVGPSLGIAAGFNSMDGD